MMLTLEQDQRSTLIEIDLDGPLYAVTFSPDGEYVVGSDQEKVRVWRVKDGKQMGTMKASQVVQCVAMSKDGNWIAAGSVAGRLFVWDAKTYEQVLKHKEASELIHGVDFSPDSARLVATVEYGGIIWDLLTRKQVQTLLHGRHWDPARGAKYSPQGDRIATATGRSVRVWDSNDGRLLVDINGGVATLFHNGLLWLKNHLFVVSNFDIKEFDAHTGSTVSECPIPGDKTFACIALPKHGEFIVYSANRVISFWDTSTHSQLRLIQHHKDIHSIAFSPDDRLLAFGGADSKITIDDLTVHTIFHWFWAFLNKFPAFRSPER